MRIGELRHRISIVRPAVSPQGTYGEVTGSPTTVGSFWCNVMYLQGFEQERIRQTWATARYKIRMRAQPGVSFRPNMRITWNARELNILDVQAPGEQFRGEVVMYAEDYNG